MKKILLIPSWYPSIKNEITGSFFREQAQTLSDTGKYDIKVLYSQVEYIGVMKFIGAAFWSASGPLLDESFLLQNPVAYRFVVRINGRIGEKRVLKILFQNYRTAYQKLISKGWVPDIIHAQSTLDAGIFAHHLSKEFNVPFFIIEHQLFLLHNYSSYKRDLVLEALRNAKKIAVVSEHQKRCLLMHLPECNPIVIWNLVDERNFSLKTISQKRKKFKIVTVTYPSPIKDYPTFFRAMHELSKLNESFEYVVIGSTSFADSSKANTDAFEKCSEEFGVRHLGSFVPYLNRADISKELASADVFVCTSIAETFGVAAREAMMCGTPVVTTACGGIEDSITTDTGVVVPIRDAKQIARAIDDIRLENTQFSAERIRNFVIHQCGQNAYLKSMRNFYED